MEIIDLVDSDLDDRDVERGTHIALVSVTRQNTRVLSRKAHLFDVAGAAVSICGRVPTDFELIALVEGDEVCRICTKNDPLS